MRLKIVDRAIAFQRCLAQIAGGAMPGLFLSQCVYWHNRTSDDEGWFHKTQDEWYEETMLTRSQQELARKELKARGLIEEVRTGNPARLYYRCNEQNIMEAIEALSSDGSIQPSSRLGEKEVANSGNRGQDAADLKAEDSQLDGSIQPSHNIHRVRIDYTESTTQAPAGTQAKEAKQEQPNKQATKEKMVAVKKESLPEHLRSDSFLELFNRYWMYRKQRRLSITDAVLQREIRTIEVYDVAVATIAIQRTMEMRWQKIWSITSLDKMEDEFSDALQLYREFYKRIASVYPPQPDDRCVVALNKVITYLKSVVLPGHSVLDALRMIFEKYDRWEPFLQKQLKLVQIERNLSNIINQIKNGTNHDKRPGAGAGTAESVTRIFNKVDEVFSGAAAR